MDGLYLYCLREKTKNSPTISSKGIDGDGEVFVLAYRQLEAVVSKVCFEEFGSDDIFKKAQEDLNWIKEKALAHEKIIEQAMRKDNKVLSLIPMRFGTIFKNKARLEESLNKDYCKIQEVLERIQSKQEWSIKLYLKDKEKFEKMIKEKNEAIKKKEQELASLPEGIAFFMEEELRETIAEEVDKELSTTMDVLFEGLKKQSVDSVRNKVLEKELTGRFEPMVLNAAYLVSEEKVENFTEVVEDLKQEMQAQGFCLEYSGPWPGFNFSSYENHD